MFISLPCVSLSLLCPAHAPPPTALQACRPPPFLATSSRVVGKARSRSTPAQGGRPPFTCHALA
eukprot:3817454-Alexandrium_andersonii.AAC.1